ncbi:MAG: hypothetical protein K2Y21_07585 [Phycisphaerales bacterium]|nr:hypothetical protein [Phycisphaerales bacterium]
MALTREQKVYLSVLFVAGAALAVDRLFLGVTNPAVAAAANAIQEVASSKPLEASSQEPASARFAARLRAAAGDSANNPVSDLFATRLVKSPASAEAAPMNAAPVSSAASIDAFKAAHRVSALASGKGAYAVINGRTVRLGEALGGMTLIEVTREHAVFEGDGHRVELSLVEAR